MIQITLSKSEWELVSDALLCRFSSLLDYPDILGEDEMSRISDVTQRLCKQLYNPAEEAEG